MNIEPVFRHYGRPASFVSKDGETVETRAFISPLRYKNKMYLYGVNTEIGYNSQGHYLYIGPPDPDLTAAADGSYIYCLGEKYRIDRAEKVYNGENPFYIWAIIRVMVETE
ncbi:MAG: hypothetical protein U0M02_14555 [Acutalibacteraceae bacterium]|nr:hypothetical protein [Acutalibacteraceae bacterium]